MAKNENQDKIEVPNIVGLHVSYASRFLEKNGLKVENIGLEEGAGKNNHVLRQSISPGTMVDKGTQLDLYICSLNPIKYLPSIYQIEDQKNNDFLKRYLWVIKEVFDSIGYKLDKLEDFFNPMTAPLDFLNWVATWFAVDVNFSIPEEKIRYLINRIVLLYQWRGTALGLKKFLEIITGYEPEILENHKPITEYIVQENKLVERVIMDDVMTNNYFTVHFPVPVKTFDLDMIKKINEVIKSEKPAHTKYYISYAKEDKNILGDGMIIGIDDFTGNSLR